MFVNGSHSVDSHALLTNFDNVTTINIPTMERPSARSADEASTPQIRFRVNGTERSIDDHGNVSARPVGGRISHLVRSHSDESIFIDIDKPQDEPPESPPPSRGFLRNKKVIRRQGSLKVRNRSYSRGKKSFFTAANETSSNLASKFVASFRLKNRDRSNTGIQGNEEGIEMIGVSRLDSFGNPSRPGPSTSVPHSPSMQKKNKSKFQKRLKEVRNAFDIV